MTCVAPWMQNKMTFEVIVGHLSLNRGHLGQKTRLIKQDLLNCVIKVACIKYSKQDGIT